MAVAPLKITQQLLPATKTYGTGNRRLYITLHQTDGYDKGLDAQWMANYQRDMSSPSNPEQKSWHYQVDDIQAIQSYGHDIHCWHAGVQYNLGNLDTIAVESCVNSDGNYTKAIQNTAKLLAWLCYTEKLDPRTKIKTHRDWSGKYCPRDIYNGRDGLTLAKVIDLTVAELAKLHAQDTTTPPKGETPNMSVTAEQILTIARRYVGTTESSSNFNYIINTYNKHRPLARSTQMLKSWDWCAAFVSFLFIEAKATNLTGTEIGVQRYVNDHFKPKGIWIGKVKPVPGDIVVFDWDAGGWADHIGIVEKVNGNTITTIEGNTNERCARNTFVWNDWRIQGYARPKYGTDKVVDTPKLSLEAVAKEVLAGKWGNGDDRTKRLTNAGYDAKAVQTKVNDLVKPAEKPVEVPKAPEGIPGLALNNHKISATHVAKIIELGKRYNISPKFLLVMSYFESYWGNSNVGKLDNNWAGMTWSPNYVGNPKIKKTMGSKRPASEGGNYTRYASAEDFLEDWVYLLRPNHFYKVSGEPDFKKAIKGLFKVGGARYDYAASGHAHYERNMLDRLTSIDKANPGVFAKLDALLPGIIPEVGTKKSIEEVAKEVIALEWGNGAERIARLKLAGFDPAIVQAKVNELVKAPATKPNLKSIATIAKEVIANKWGHGAERVKRLTEAGYNANAVQDEVNREVKRLATETVAKEVIDGKWGNNPSRSAKLKAAGFDPKIVQERVNALLK